MRKLVLYLLLVVVSTVLLVILRSELAVGILIGLITAAAIPLLDELVSQRRSIKYAWLSVRYWRSMIRVSASYLFRIKVDDKYLLVRGVRFPDQFQPVGGVFKVFPEGRQVLHDLDVLDDDLLPIDETSKDDARVRVPGRHLFEFMRWYDSGRGRETETWREFSEELIRPGHLSSSTFPYVSVRHIRRIDNPIRFSEYAQSKELLIADVYELLPTLLQSEELKRLSASSSGQLLWTSEEDIRRLGFQPKEPQKVRIAMTAAWTL